MQATKVCLEVVAEATQAAAASASLLTPRTGESSVRFRPGMSAPKKWPSRACNSDLSCCASGEPWVISLAFVVKSDPFDHNAVRGLYVWFDREPPHLNGVIDIHNIRDKKSSTALESVFSGGV